MKENESFLRLFALFTQPVVFTDEQEGFLFSEAHLKTFAVQLNNCARCTENFFNQRPLILASLRDYYTHTYCT